MPGMHLRFEITPKEFLEELTEAVYKIALKRRTGGSFIELELELWNVLREIIRRDMLVTEMCGSDYLGRCQSACRFEPWSKEAENLGLESTPLLSEK